MKDRDAHGESIGEHLITSDNVRVQQHGGKVYKVKYSGGRFWWWGEVEKKSSRSMIV
jgi:hypothetical protein